MLSKVLARDRLQLLQDLPLLWCNKQLPVLFLDVAPNAVYKDAIELSVELNSSVGAAVPLGGGFESILQTSSQLSYYNNVEIEVAAGI